LLEVADIFRRHGAAYRQKFAKRLLPRHLRAMAAIESCRTAALGGQVFRCDHCDQKLYAYHSCKNRHCPKCHGEQTRRWLNTQRGRLLLNCSFYHLTFTLPEEMRPLARAHSKVIYRLLMQAAAAAILKLARDPRYLGAATPGLLAVLHTWTRAMLYHPHVHLLVTAGGISGDGAAWVQPKHPRFFLPERPLSAIFRGKFRYRLRKAGLYALVPKTAWEKSWVVDCKYAGRGEKVLHYLGRYLFRIAIANSRLDCLAQTHPAQTPMRQHPALALLAKSRSRPPGRCAAFLPRPCSRSPRSPLPLRDPASEPSAIPISRDIVEAPAEPRSHIRRI
jgi:putative transposase/transposase-like zinc-binding protein